MLGFIKLNLKYIGNVGLKIAGSLFSLLTLWLTFVSWDDMGITSKCNRLLSDQYSELRVVMLPVPYPFDNYKNIDEIYGDG